MLDLNNGSEILRVPFFSTKSQIVIFLEILNLKNGAKMCYFMCYNVKNNVIIVISWNEVYKKNLVQIYGQHWGLQSMKCFINILDFLIFCTKDAKWRKQIAKKIVQWIRPRNNMLVFPKSGRSMFFSYASKMTQVGERRLVWSDSMSLV